MPYTLADREAHAVALKAACKSLRREIAKVESAFHRNRELATAANDADYIELRTEASVLLAQRTELLALEDITIDKRSDAIGALTEAKRADRRARKARRLRRAAK